MNKFLLSSILFLVQLPLLAQKTFRDGNIYKSVKGSVHGSIAFNSDFNNSLICTFKDESNQIKKYTPGEIEAYRFDQGKYYVSKFVKINGTINHRFAEYLVKGKKNIYYVRDKGFHYFIDYKSDTINEIPYQQKSFYRDGITYQSKSLIHQDILKAYFNDCPALFPKIDQLKKPSFNSLIQLTKEYNKLICGDSCIAYSKPKWKFEAAFELQAGTVNYNKFIGPTGYIAQESAYLYLWLPQSSEQLYFKTGLSYANYKNSSILKVPIQMEYMLSPGYVRPKIDLGFNYYNINYSADEGGGKGKALMLAGSIGMLFQISNVVFWDLSVSSDLWGFVYGTPFYVSTSFETGLFFKLHR